MEQGDIWLLERPDTKPRPCLVLTRTDALRWMASITIAPLTTTVREIATEVRMGRDDGVPVDSVATFDNVRTVGRGSLTRRLGRMSPGRWHEVCAAMRAAIDC